MSGPYAGAVSLPAERCSVASDARGEALAGTASIVRSWLLLEHPGPWGRDAFLDGRHAGEGFGPALLARCRAAGVRPLLIRRPDGGSDAARPRCVAIRSGPEEPWVESARLDHPSAALDLDLDALGHGERIGLAPWSEPLLLVCTHGRHDVCCAERGRPLAQALAAALPEATWEASHIGGDRFAGNVLAFPHGIYFGRVAPGDAERVVRSYLEGRLSLPHLRGRSCLSMPVQAAEHALRVELGLDGIGEVAFEHATSEGTALSASFATPTGTWTVALSVGASQPHRLTCRSRGAEAAPTYRVVSILPPTRARGGAGE